MNRLNRTLSLSHYLLKARFPAFLSFSGLIATLSPAAAATVAAGTIVDISPIVQALIGLAAALITILGGMATVWLNNSRLLKNDAAAQAAVDLGMTKGAGLLRTLLTSVGAPQINLDVHSPLIAQAITYAVKATDDDALKAKGIDPNTPDGQTHIANAILAHLGMGDIGTAIASSSSAGVGNAIAAAAAASPAISDIAAGRLPSASDIVASATAAGAVLKSGGTMP